MAVLPMLYTLGSVAPASVRKWFYKACNLGTTAGLLAARLGPKRAICAALLLGAVVSFTQALQLPYGLMILSRILEGISHLSIVVAGPILIASLAGETIRAFAMTLWASFFGVAYALLGLIAPPLLAFGGMQALFLGHGLWMALLALLLMALLPPDPPRETRPIGNLIARHLALYRSPRIAAPAMGFCFYTFLYVASLTLLPPEAPLSVRALMQTSMPLISILVSLTFGVWALSKVSAVRLVQVGYLAAIPGFLIATIFWGTPMGMLLGGLWLSAALGIAQGASFASIPELNHSDEDRAGAAGAVAQLGNVGTTLGTPLLAVVLGKAGPFAFGAIAVICCLGGILLHLWQGYRRRNS